MKSDETQHVQAANRDGGQPSPNYALLGNTTFDEVFRSGSSVWIKMATGAVATCIMVALGLARSVRRGGELELDNTIVGVIFAGAAVIGAAMGAALSFKDVVETRRVEGKPVAFPLKLLFGYGIWSLLLIWFPGILVLTLVITVMALSAFS